MIDETRLRHRFEAVRGQLDERGLRLMAAAEARAAGYGGIAAVARATGTPACRPPSTHQVLSPSLRHSRHWAKQSPCHLGETSATATRPNALSIFRTLQSS